MQTSVLNAEEKQTVCPQMDGSARASGAKRPSTVTSRFSYPMPWNAALVLALTCVLALVWSHYKLLWLDEIMEMQTDGLPSLRQLVHVQTHFPISLDPLLYHAVTHLSLRLFGLSTAALRLPALLGFLLMQACLGLFVRRMATERAAIFAMAFPAGTAMLYFSAEARPYGLLMGLCALMMLAWQSATRRNSHRLLALLTLAAAIALALNTHYFGVLLLAPIMIAEGARTLHRRRLDLPVLGSIAAGAAGILCVLPFKRGAAQFQTHYYNLHLSGREVLAQAYHALLLDESYLSPAEQRLFVLCGWVLAAILVWASVRLLRKPTLLRPRYEVALAVALAALPVFGYLFERFVTHTMQSRYVCEAICGVAAIMGIGLDKIVPRRWNSRAAVALLAPLMLLPNVLMVYRIAGIERARLASPVCRVPDDIRAAVEASPTQLLYTPNVSLFDQLATYEPDPWMRSHLALVYSEQRELRYAQRDTFTLTARHMRHFTQYDIIDFDELASQPGEHIFVSESKDNSWDWIRPSLLAQRDTFARIEPYPPKVDFLFVQFAAPANTAKLTPAPAPPSSAR